MIALAIDLGMEKDVYDRFLAEHPTALTMGLCNEANKVTTITAEPHDIQLDMVITEDAIYKKIDDIGSK